MAVAPLRIPTLAGGNAVVDKEGRPTPEFLRSINGALGRITMLLNQIAALPEIQDQLGSLGETLATAQEVIDEVQQATTAAQNAADSANEAIDQIANGTLELEAVKIGGQRFVNDGGVLTVEP